MAVVTDRVVVELEAKMDRYNANVARAENRFDKAMGGIQKSAGATEKFVARAMGGVSAALAGVSVVALARAFLSIADEAKKLDSTLKLATAGFGSFGQAQKDVQRIADETRSGLTETASLYANFVRGAKELGGSQAQAARATETFSKTLKISGADANQAASATLQFGQALAAGALRGDELNSILEASPRLARLLADAMGRPIGEIKKLGEEGALTSDKLLKALTDKKFTAGIDAEFKQVPVTFDDAMTRIYNSAVTTFSAFDRGGEFSTMLANFFSEGADGFSGMESAAFDTGAEIRATFAGLADVFQPMIDAAFGAFDKIEGRANYARDSIGNMLRLLDNADNFFKDIDNFGRRFDNGVKSTINEAARRAGNKGGQFTLTPLVDRSDRAGKFLKAFDDSLRQSQGKRAEDQFRSRFGGTDALGNPLPGTPGARSAVRAPSASTSGGKKTNAPKSKIDAEAFAREEASLNDQILRLKGDEVVGVAEKAKIEIDRIEASKKAAAEEYNKDERLKPEWRKQLVAMTETAAALQTASVIAERDTALAEQVAEARRGNLRYEHDALQAQAQGADTRRDRLAAERRLLTFIEQQEQSELETAIAAGKIADATKARADLASAQGARRGAAERDGESPLARYASDLGRTDTSDRIEELVVQELDYVKDGISSAITKRLGIKDPFLAGLLDMFIQNTIMKPLAEAFSSQAGGGFGGFISAIGGVFGFASGGSMTLGGRGGTDTNRLSLNGRPIANVSRGETLSVGNKTLGGRANSPSIIQPIIQVDARGAVMNDQFARMILAQAGQNAQKTAAQMGQGILKAVPARMSQFQADGT